MERKIERCFDLLGKFSRLVSRIFQQHFVILKTRLALIDQYLTSFPILYYQMHLILVPKTMQVQTRNKIKVQARIAVILWLNLPHMAQDARAIPTLIILRVNQHFHRRLHVSIPYNYVILGIYVLKHMKLHFIVCIIVPLYGTGICDI